MDEEREDLDRRKGEVRGGGKKRKMWGYLRGSGW